MKPIIACILLGGLTSGLFAFVPFFFGARSLALGQSSVAFIIDVNAIHVNPSLLTSLPYSVTGVQYQHQYLDYKDFTRNLSGLLGRDLKNYAALPAAEKAAVFADLQGIFRSRAGICGFQQKDSSFASSGYGISLSLVDEAVVSPLPSPSLNKSVDQLTNDDIANLKLNYLGWHYTQYSVAYSLPITSSISIGTAVNYLKGQVSDIDVGILDSRFSPESTSRDYLSTAWENQQTRLSKITMDAGISANFAQVFSLAVVMRNLFNPVIQTSKRTLNLPRRVIAGLAFRSADFWGIHLDMDIVKNDLQFNGNKTQPISLGIEKGFFQNLFALRVGMLNDLSEENLLGSRSNILYGLGMGFNLTRFQVDLALALSRTGAVKSLAISGFFIVKAKGGN